ncbi:hypothetical protein [Kineococcus indalonis]|uniref:hypothetical protein n=1 Tax=Kineococcus indalonis TaxID=2696566 RepID=UPI0014121E45|nr:hypothetical protein [Kineococcus indalonis]NAZ87298.1 hypothetical protein [Kineococcus indalonis]
MAAGAEAATEVLRAEVASLEAENMNLLARYAAQLRSSNEQIRQSLAGSAAPSPAAAPSIPSAVLAEARPPHSVTRLARDLVAVEEHLAEMDRCAGLGDLHGAGLAKQAAARRTCRALGLLCDDADFRELLMAMPERARQAQDPVGGVPDPAELHGPLGTFRDTEVALLQLVGLSRALADRHVDAAIAAFTESPQAWTRMQDPAALLRDLRTLRDATCTSADMLAAGVQREASRARWRKILTYGMGGCLLIAADGAAELLLGVPMTALSEAVGGAAVGVAAPLSS